MINQAVQAQVPKLRHSPVGLSAASITITLVLYDICTRNQRKRVLTPLKSQLGSSITTVKSLKKRKQINLTQRCLTFLAKSTKVKTPKRRWSLTWSAAHQLWWHSWLQWDCTQKRCWAFNKIKQLLSLLPYSPFASRSILDSKRELSSTDYSRKHWKHMESD